MGCRSGTHIYFPNHKIPLSSSVNSLVLFSLMSYRISFSFSSSSWPFLISDSSVGSTSTGTTVSFTITRLSYLISLHSSSRILLAKIVFHVRAARGCRGSPAIAREDEGDEVGPVAGSPELERRWRGVTVEVKSQQQRASAQEQRRIGESSKARRGGAMVAGGSSGVYIGTRGGVGESSRLTVNGVNTTDG
jgi:hypothetical protein